MFNTAEIQPTGQVVPKVSKGLPYGVNIQAAIAFPHE